MLIIISTAILLLSHPPLKTLFKTAQHLQETAGLNPAGGTGQNPDVQAGQKQAREWFSKSHAFITLSILVMLGGALFLKAGAIGYQTKLIRGQTAKAADFITAGRASFLLLAAAHLTALLAMAIPVLICGGLILVLFAFLPGLKAQILGFILGAAITFVVFYLVARLGFIAVAAAADRKGPAEAWKQSFRITRGRIVHLAGFAVTLAFMMAGVEIMLKFLSTASAAIPGLSFFFLAAVSLAGAVLKAYIGFVRSSAWISYYDTALSFSSGQDLR